jgi:RND family efflux transporter MFP subunit
MARNGKAKGIEGYILHNYLVNSISWKYFMINARSFFGLLASLILSLSASANSGEEIFVVMESDRQPTIAIGGTVVPYQQVTLTAQLPGRIKFIAGIEGDRFEEGTTLLAIDETELLAQRSAAYAQLAAVDAQLRNAGVQYSRELWSPKSKSAPGGMGMPNLFDQMFTQGAESFMGQRERGAERSADLYASSTRIEQAKSAILRAQSEIQAIDAKLRDAKSLAPFEGVIMSKSVEVGDTVQPGQSLLVFADVAWLQVEIDIPARLVSGLEEMMVLSNAGSFDNASQPVSVRVAQIYPMADSRRHTIKVKFDIPQGVTQPGMYARIEIPDITSIGRAQSLEIPASSIQYRGSLPVVYVQNAEGKPELRLIREGKTLGGGMVTVLTGLALGDRIYRNPTPNLLTR